MEQKLKWLEETILKYETIHDKIEYYDFVFSPVIMIVVSIFTLLLLYIAYATFRYKDDFEQYTIHNKKYLEGKTDKEKLKEYKKENRFYVGMCIICLSLVVIVLNAHYQIYDETVKLTKDIDREEFMEDYNEKLEELREAYVKILKDGTKAEEVVFKEVEGEYIHYLKDGVEEEAQLDLDSSNGVFLNNKLFIMKETELGTLLNEIKMGETVLLKKYDIETETGTLKLIDGLAEVQKKE